MPVKDLLNLKSARGVFHKLPTLVVQLSRNVSKNDANFL